MTRGQWLAARLGLDSNPLRRRTDRLEGWIGAALLVALLIGAPLLAVVAGNLTAAAGMRELRAQRSWHQVSAVVLLSAPDIAPGYSYSDIGGWAEARWQAAGGRTHVGVVAVPDGARAGSAVRIWVNSSGQAAGFPVRRAQVAVWVITAVVLPPLALGLVLVILYGCARWLLDRRRLRAWETAWASVGPAWTGRR
jgi:hypothetical protein